MTTTSREQNAGTDPWDLVDQLRGEDAVELHLPSPLSGLDDATELVLSVVSIKDGKSDGKPMSLVEFEMLEVSVSTATFGLRGG